MLIGTKASKFLSTLTDNSQKRIKNKCKGLVEDPYPGQGDDKELIERGRKSAYRLHVARSYTVFYRINENDKEVKILKITTIEQAHKLYGRLDL